MYAELLNGTRGVQPGTEWWWGVGADNTDETEGNKVCDPVVDITKHLGTQVLLQYKRTAFYK